MPMDEGESDIHWVCIILFPTKDCMFQLAANLFGPSCKNLGEHTKLLVCYKITFGTCSQDKYGWAKQLVGGGLEGLVANWK